MLQEKIMLSYNQGVVKIRGCKCKIERALTVHSGKTPTAATHKCVYELCGCVSGYRVVPLQSNYSEPVFGANLLIHVTVT